MTFDSQDSFPQAGCGVLSQSPADSRAVDADVAMPARNVDRMRRASPPSASDEPVTSSEQRMPVGCAKDGHRRLGIWQACVAAIRSSSSSAIVARSSVDDERVRELTLSARARARARASAAVEEDRIDEKGLSPPILFDKQTYESTTASEESVATGTDMSAGDAEDPRHAMLEHVVERLEETSAQIAELEQRLEAASEQTPTGFCSPSSHHDSNVSGHSSSATSSGRKGRRRPPQGLPPTCLVEGVTPVAWRGCQFRGDLHMGAAPASGFGTTAAQRASDARHRAEWVEDSALTI